MLKDMTVLDRTLALTPGASQTRSKAPGRVGPRDTADKAFPLFARHGDGAYLVDIEGRRFLDFAGANAAVPLGYSYASVDEAVADVVSTGPLLSLPSQLEREVAEQLLAAVRAGQVSTYAGAPWAQQVRFVKTGSEACTGALLLAQSFTGAERVWVGRWAYHGWHPWAAQRARRLVRQYDLNDEAMLDELEPGAVVFFEPPRFTSCDTDWLHKLRGHISRVGGVLVFDEMVMGFRLRLAGGSEFYGVSPDLAVYGKALANGYALAAIVGRRDVMEAAAGMVSGTFGGDRVGLAAAGAVLREYERGVVGRLWDSGRYFHEVYGGLRHGGELEGHPVHWRVRWPSPEVADRVLAMCAATGVLFHRDANNASAVMTREEVQRGAFVLATSMTEVAGR